MFFLYSYAALSCGTKWEACGAWRRRLIRDDSWVLGAMLKCWSAAGYGQWEGNTCSSAANLLPGYRKTSQTNPPPKPLLFFSLTRQTCSLTQSTSPALWSPDPLWPDPEHWLTQLPTPQEPSVFLFPSFLSLSISFSVSLQIIVCALPFLFKHSGISCASTILARRNEKEVTRICLIMSMSDISWNKEEKKLWYRIT